MSPKKIALKATKWIATGILTTGAVIAIGLLSYCGMLAISPSLVFAWIAFSLSGFIEGEVYLQNIGNGIENLKLLGKHGIDALIIKSINEKLNELKKSKKELSETADVLIKEYYKQRKYVASFEYKKLTRDQKEEKEKASKRLRRMQKMLVARVLSQDKTNDETIKAVRDSLSTLRRKIWYLRISVPICIGAGIAFGFATAAALDAALISLTIASAVTVWPLAAVACVGYAFLIYYTVSDMICNETFIKWRDKVFGWFKRDTLESGEKKPVDTKYVLRVIGISALLALSIGLGIVATLATAGTWWLAVKNGALLLPIAASAANHIRNILVPLASAATLVFTIRNSLKTVKEIVKDIKTRNPIDYVKQKYTSAKNTFKEIIHSHPIEFLKQKKQEYAKDKSWGQIFNPFRIIAAIIRAPFLCLVFAGHLASVGLTGDRAPGLNYAATIASAIFGALSDGFVDYHYIMGREHDHKPHKEHDHHSHGLIANTILKVFLSPILLLAAGWDVLFASKLDKESKPAKERFITALKSNFGIKEHIHEGKPKPKPQVSLAYLNEEMKYRFDKQRKRLANPLIDKKIATEKSQALDKIEQDLLAEKIPEKVSYEDTLKKRRTFLNDYHLFAPEKCTSERVAEDVIAEYTQALR